MINIEIKLDKLIADYPDFYRFFKESLSHSQSRFKNYKESKYKCYYYVGTYIKPSQKTEEYYENLYNMKWENRLNEEFKKTRVTITMAVGKFALTDQTIEICETVKPILEEVIARKMYMEQISSEEQNEEVMSSIPNVDELKDKIEEEKVAQQGFLEKMGLSIGANIKAAKDLKPEERLAKLIQEEKYEEAEDYINKHPELKKRDEE